MHLTAGRAPISSMPARSVPPVAMRSSTSSTRCPRSIAPACISILSDEYSVSYCAQMHSPARQHQQVGMLMACTWGAAPVVWSAVRVRRCSSLTPTWELSRLAQRNKSASERERQRRAEDEATSLKACGQAGSTGHTGHCGQCAAGVHARCGM